MNNSQSNHVQSIPQKALLKQVIAVIGCDGSGKSTLTLDLLDQLKSENNIELLYLGQSSGNIADWIRSLPIIGAPLGRYLVNKAKKAHKTNDNKNSSPDTATMVVIYLLSKWRVHKFKKMLKLCKKNTVVITDRYPQAEVAGFYFDGTGLGAMTPNTWLGKYLQNSEKKLYQWMASYIPQLVIRLNIDAETAYSRKPDHKLSMLQDKISVIPQLNFNDAHILELDSRTPYKEVLDEALTTAQSLINKS